MYMYHYRQGYSKLSTGQRLWCPCTIYIYIYICVYHYRQRYSNLSTGQRFWCPCTTTRFATSKDAFAEEQKRSQGCFFSSLPTPPSLFFSLFRSLPTSLSHTPLSLPSLPSLPPSIFRSLCVFYCLSCSPGGGTWCCTEDFPVLNSNL